MAVIERSVEIDKPPDEVFAVLTDTDKLPHWATVVEETRNCPKPMTDGCTFQQSIRIAGVLKLDVDCRVEHIEAPKSVTYVADGPGGARARMTQQVAPAGAGSRVEIEIDYDLPGGVLGDLIDRVYVERRNEREAEHSLANLKDLLEGRRS
jgi:carbon monoxide dehydrogenase subunit G